MWLSSGGWEWEQKWYGTSGPMFFTVCVPSPSISSPDIMNLTSRVEMLTVQGEENLDPNHWKAECPADPHDFTWVRHELLWLLRPWDLGTCPLLPPASPNPNSIYLWATPVSAKVCQCSVFIIFPFGELLGNSLWLQLRVLQWINPIVRHLSKVTKF